MINILIADDHAIVRSGLRQIIATSGDIAVSAEAAGGAEVLDMLRRIPVDLLLLDMNMPGISGLDLIGRIRIEWPALGIVIFSMHNEAQIASRALKAGASGYVTKDSDPNILMAAIRKVAQGGRFIDPSLVDAIVFKDHSVGDAPPHEILSNREYQVLQRLAAGESINDIARTFSLSAKTVSTHKVRLMRKLGLDNNIDLARYAIKHSMVQ